MKSPQACPDFLYTLLLLLLKSIIKFILCIINFAFTSFLNFGRSSIYWQRASNQGSVWFCLFVFAAAAVCVCPCVHVLEASSI